MTIKIINTKEEFAAFWYYSKWPKNGEPDKYPESYPCIAKMESAGGGLAGEYMAHYVKYMPKTKSHKAILENAAAEWIYLC